MKWSNKTGERIFGWPLVVLTAPAWVPLFAVLYVVVQADMAMKAVTRKFAHPRDPHQWFAWRPVQMSVWSDHSNEWRWMETIWRGRDRWGETALAPTRESLESAQ